MTIHTTLMGVAAIAVLAVGSLAHFASAGNCASCTTDKMKSAGKTEMAETVAKDHEGMEASKESVANPKIIALAFHADWCGACKELGPKVMQTMKDIGDTPVLFVKFDLTNEATKRQSEYLAGAIGVGDLYAEHGKKTGFVLLVDAQTQKVLGKFTRETSSKDMLAELKELTEDDRAALAN